MKIIFDRDEQKFRGWVLRVLFGQGAGYINGSTLYLAYKSGSAWWKQAHRGISPSLLTRITGFEVGLTKNANNVPWTSH